ncbi:MAG: Abi family protein [Ornithinimicrobium sp.]
MPTYDKPHLNVSEQVELLRSRGMHVGSTDYAESWLSVVGYYRLSGYWYPYREIVASHPAVRGDRFLPSTTLEQVIGLYEFDRRLKLRVLDALERIEIAMRFRVGYTLGLRGPFAHRDAESLDTGFSRPRPESKRLFATEGVTGAGAAVRG